MPRIRSMIRFMTESRMNVPADQIFAFLDDPASFEQLFPPQERAKAPKGQQGLITGKRLVLVLYGGFMPARWVLETTKLESPHFFEQTMVHGPFRHFRHRCRLMPDGKDGTLIRDSVEFQMRYGWLGWFFARRRARRRLRAIFSHRHSVILKAMTGRTYDTSELRCRDVTGSNLDDAEERGWLPSEQPKPKSKRGRFRSKRKF